MLQMLVDMNATVTWQRQTYLDRDALGVCPWQRSIPPQRKLLLVLSDDLISRGNIQAHHQQTLQHPATRNGASGVAISY